MKLLRMHGDFTVLESDAKENVLQILAKMEVFARKDMTHLHVTAGTLQIRYKLVDTYCCEKCKNVKRFGITIIILIHEIDGHPSKVRFVLMKSESI